MRASLPVPLLLLLGGLLLWGEGCVTPGVKGQKARGIRDLGYAYLQEGKIGDAIDQLRQAVKLTPRDAEAWMKLGLAYYAREVYDEAESAFDRATTLRPSYPEAWVNWGSLKLKQQKWGEAIPLLQKAADDPIYREPGRAIHNLGWAWFNLGEYQKARGEYQKVLKVTPFFCPSVYNLGLVYEAEGNLSEALRLYQRARECNPKDLNVYFSEGALHLKLDEWDEGRKLLELVSSQDPNGDLGAKARILLAESK